MSRKKTKFDYQVVMLPDCSIVSQHRNLENALLHQRRWIKKASAPGSLMHGDRFGIMFNGMLMPDSRKLWDAIDDANLKAAARLKIAEQALRRIAYNCDTEPALRQIAKDALAAIESK